VTSVVGACAVSLKMAAATEATWKEGPVCMYGPSSYANSIFCSLLARFLFFLLFCLFLCLFSFLFNGRYEAMSLLGSCCMNAFFYFLIFICVNT